MNKKLFPSCSEIVWRLNIPKPTKERIIDSLDDTRGGTEETATDSYPNGCVNNMLSLLKDYNRDIDDVNLELIDNLGGGGNGDYVEKCFEKVKKFKKGEITREELDMGDENDW